MREAGITLIAKNFRRALGAPGRLVPTAAVSSGTGTGYKELAMAKDQFEQFVMPSEMRAFAERGVEQARQAFDGFVQAATTAMAQFQGSAQAAQSGATEIAQKSITYAEQNVEATFDFAQKLMKAKDGAEVLGLQSEFLSRQMQALSSQVQDLGQSAAKIVVDAAKPKT
jgi:phasin